MIWLPSPSLKMYVFKDLHPPCVCTNCIQNPKQDHEPSVMLSIKNTGSAYPCFSFKTVKVYCHNWHEVTHGCLWKIFLEKSNSRIHLGECFRKKIKHFDISLVHHKLWLFFFTENTHLNTNQKYNMQHHYNTLIIPIFYLFKRKNCEIDAVKHGTKRKPKS